MQRVLAIAVVIGALACSGKNGPPPRAEEVPIQHDPPPPPPPPEAAEPAPEPVAAAAPPTPPASATASAKPAAKPAKGAKLTDAECSRLADRFVMLAAASQGVPMNDRLGQNAIHTAAAGDPNYRNMIDACKKDNTKTQYNCGMKAIDMQTWQDCLK
jgi:hypothetical protein